VPVFDTLAGALVATVALIVIVPLVPAASAPSVQLLVDPLVLVAAGLADTKVRPAGSVSATTEPAGTVKVLLFRYVSMYWMFAPTAAVAGPDFVIWMSGYRIVVVTDEELLPGVVSVWPLGTAIVAVLVTLVGALVLTVALIVIVPLWPAASAPSVHERVEPLVEDAAGLADTNVRPVGSVSWTTAPAGTLIVLLFL